MSRPKTIDDEQILAAAREVFRTRGHVASTREIARAVGLSEAVLYQRFGSKDGLFFAAMGLPTPDVEAILGPAAPPGADARATLCAITARLVAHFAEVVPTILQLLTHPSSATATMEQVHQVLPRKLVDGVAQRLGAMIEAGSLGPVDPAAAALWLVSAAHSLGHLAILPGHKTPGAAQIDALVGVLWSGLAPPLRAPKKRAAR